MKVFRQSAVYFFQCNANGGFSLILDYSKSYLIEYSSTKILDSGSPAYVVLFCVKYSMSVFVVNWDLGIVVLALNCY